MTVCTCCSRRFQPLVPRLPRLRSATLRPPSRLTSTTTRCRRLHSPHSRDSSLSTGTSLSSACSRWCGSSSECRSSTDSRGPHNNSQAHPYRHHPDRQEGTIEAQMTWCTAIGVLCVHALLVRVSFSPCLAVSSVQSPSSLLCQRRRGAAQPASKQHGRAPCACTCSRHGTTASGGSDACDERGDERSHESALGVADSGTAARTGTFHFAGSSVIIICICIVLLQHHCG